MIVGADGFGYVQNRMQLKNGHPEQETYHHRVPHIGRVVIEDDVEVGANTTIDRATLAETRIGRGTKIDNQVQIGHNVRIGQHCLICGQVGLSGSVQLGDYVVIGGQAACLDHVKIGDGAMIAAKAGVSKDVPAAARMVGAPAIESGNGIIAYALIQKLPTLWKRSRDHSRRIAELESKNSR